MLIAPVQRWSMLRLEMEAAMAMKLAHSLVKTSISKQAQLLLLATIAATETLLVWSAISMETQSVLSWGIEAATAMVVALAMRVTLKFLMIRATSSGSVAEVQHETKLHPRRGHCTKD